MYDESTLHGYSHADTVIAANKNELYMTPAEIRKGEQDYEKVEDLSIFEAKEIRCCMCGVMTTPNASNTCIRCLKNQINITEGFPEKFVVNHCRECNRFMKQPRHWMYMEPESSQLLNHCLKQVKNFTKYLKFTDATFVWTEPHCKRLKVRLTIQKEVLDKTMLEKTVILDFFIQNTQCEACKKTYTPHLWKSQVQVRQKVDHKRTFLFLEQLILASKMHEKVFDMQESEGGINFQFGHKNAASNFAHFIKDNISCKCTNSKQLISHDEQDGTYNFKYTFLVELAPVCREDLVFLPKALAKDLGGIGPLVLVYKISKFIHIVDIQTMYTYEVDQNTYWKNPFKALLDRERLTEFIILDIEYIDTDLNNSRAALKQKFSQVKLQVVRKCDFGAKIDQIYFVNSHLGEILNCNDTVLAYDLE